MSQINMTNTDPGEGAALPADTYLAIYGGISLLDLFYPVGMYIETSDPSFDPNVVWGGVWVEDTWGRVTVAYQSNQPLFDQVGEIGGDLIHRHDFKIGMYSFYGGVMGDNYKSGANGNGAFSYSQNIFSKEVLRGDGGQTERNNGLQSGYTSYTEPWLRISKGDTDLGSSLQPYIVVKRWHRTA